MDVRMFVYMGAYMLSHVHLIQFSKKITSALEHRSLMCAWETAQVTRQASLLGLIE